MVTDGALFIGLHNLEGEYVESTRPEGLGSSVRVVWNLVSSVLSKNLVEVNRKKVWFVLVFG